jgi:glycerate kinase
MRWVIAPDSYKGSLEAVGVAQAMQEGIARVDHQAVCILRPMADGGEGTLDALHAAVGGVAVLSGLQCHGAEHDVGCLLLPDGTVVLEVARIIGLPDAGSSDVKDRSSRGVGQLLLALVNAGHRHIAVALGGSSTNDAGAGCLVAMGLQLMNADGVACMVACRIWRLCMH